MVDVDHFKVYNDHYGHQRGDECLRAVATALAAATKRPGDHVSRYGGEEFSVLLPGTDQRGALLVADRIIAGIAGMAIEHRGAASNAVSVSVVTGQTPLPWFALPTARCTLRSVAAAPARGPRRSGFLQNPWHRY